MSFLKFLPTIFTTFEHNLFILFFCKTLHHCLHVIVGLIKIQMWFVTLDHVFSSFFACHTTTNNNPQTKLNWNSSRIHNFVFIFYISSIAKRILRRNRSKMCLINKQYWTFTWCGWWVEYFSTFKISFNFKFWISNQMNHVLNFINFHHFSSLFIHRNRDSLRHQKSELNSKLKWHSICSLSFMLNLSGLALVWWRWSDNEDKTLIT